MTRKYRVNFYDEDGSYLETEIFFVHDDEDLSDMVEEFIMDCYGEDTDIEYDETLIDVYG